MVWVKDEGSKGGGFSNGEVGETMELREGEGEVGFKCNGEGRCGLTSRRTMCDGDSARYDGLIAMVVRWLLALPASDTVRAEELRVIAVDVNRGLKIVLLSISSSPSFLVRRSGDDVLAELKDSRLFRLSESKLSAFESLSPASSFRASSALLIRSSRSISAATWALISGVTRTQAKVRNCVTQPPRMSQARISI